MEETSMSKLSQTLQQNAEAERKEIEELTKAELKELAESLKDGVQSELSTTKGDIKKELLSILSIVEQEKPSIQKNLREIEKASQRQKDSALKHLKWSWLKYGIPAFIVLIVICVSTWGLNQYLFSSLQMKLETISKAERTLRQLPAGVSFKSDQSGNYLVFENKPLDKYTSNSGHFVVKLEK